MENLRVKHAEELQGLQDLVQELRAKESQLEKDMKKRGDAARQMLVAKDLEIETLKKTIASSSLSSLVAAGKQQQQLPQQQEPLPIGNAMQSSDADAGASAGLRGNVGESEVADVKRNLDDILSQEEVCWSIELSFLCYNLIKFILCFSFAELLVFNNRSVNLTICCNNSNLHLRIINSVKRFIVVLVYVSRSCWKSSKC